MSDAPFSTNISDSTPFEVDCADKASVRFTLAGDWVGQLQVEMSTNGSYWEPTTNISPLLNQSFAGLQMNGMFIANVVAIKKIRFYFSSLDSGSLDLDGIVSERTAVITQIENTVSVRGDVRIIPSEE